MKIVVLGGYGNFGARICRALASSPDIELVVAGRDIRRGAELATALGNGTTSVRMDITGDGLAQALRDIGAELVIHTAGPFQQQGYKVPFAVAAAGAHYIDLADGRRFVCDFPQALHSAFCESGRIAISGASTVPALSSAVVNALTEGWQKIDAIGICIAPAQTAPRGVATLAAVLNYCGAPIQVWQDRQWITQYGWERLARVKFARLRPRIGALCDIPDLELFPAHFKGVGSVVFRAALEVGLTQRAFSVMAKLRRYGMLRHPEKFAGFLNTTAGAFDFLGTSLGGMVVRVKGVSAAGKSMQRSWHIAADHDHGPEIPCMAAILLARRLARSEISAVGAYACMDWLTLADFGSEFSKWGMVTDMIDDDETSDA